MIPRRVWIAVLIAFVCHGFFILTARYRLSYDAYTHMLFAQHYASDWFSLWEPRWYTGFTVASYPPLTHQLIALFIPILGFDAAYGLVLWIVTATYPLGVYAFSRIFTGRTAASYAALASALLMSIFVAAHMFGQLPFLTSTLFALLTAAALNRYLRDGGGFNLALSISLVATTMAAHHATLLVQPFFLLAVLVRQFRRERWQSLARRLALFLVLAVPAGILVIWPFWQWGLHQTMQTPIDHLSRHNFLTDPLAQAIFFWPMYGPLVAVIPFLFRKWPIRFWGLTFAFSVLFVLGLGGTTPLPSLLFGKGWEWLTYDRFAFWASLSLLPFFGILFIRLKSRWKDRRLSAPVPASLRRAWLPALTFSVFAASALGTWLTPILFPVQPAPVDMRPIVAFLNADDRSQWHYVTFGFGDQFAHLNLLTQATTIDGSYHTARTLPELRVSGIGQLDTAFWAANGLELLEPILPKLSERGVRWAFVNKVDYLPLLEQNGWVFVETLSDKVEVWENPRATRPVETKPPQDLLAAFSWGILPMLALVTSSALGALRLWPAQAEKALRGIHAFVIGLLPIGLCFWYYVPVAQFPHPRVYFTYSDALFFVTDALALLAVILWLTWRTAISSVRKFNSFEKLFLAFCLLASLSVFWSADWRTSLYVALHLWLILGLILSLRDWPAAWKPLTLGLCAALGIQLVAGLVEFATQSTALVSVLNLNWPGLLDPSVRGASVVQLPNGVSFLRAYGTLPHPNLLGGLAFVCLLGPAALYLRRERPNSLAPLLLGLGTCLLALTFSRSAWLAVIAFVMILFWKSKFFDRKRLIILALAAGLGFGLTLLPFHALVEARTVSQSAPTEQFSNTARVWLSGQALQMIRERPLTGMGIGSFILALAQRAGEGYIIEPAHNLLLLAAAELGIPGLLLVLALAIHVARELARTTQPEKILIGAGLAGLAVIGLFDHYLWTLAPGRILLGLMLGLWAGRDEHAA